MKLHGLLWKNSWPSPGSSAAVRWSDSSKSTKISNCWQTPIQVSGAETIGLGVGGDITTHSFGDVFAMWPDTSSHRLLLAKSTNGGASFSAPLTIFTTFGSYKIGVPSNAQHRVVIYISAGAYRTTADDLVYGVWTDLTGAPDCKAPANEPGSNVSSTCKSRIWFSRSTNGGTTWESARMINNQSSLNDQFNPRLAVDEARRRLVVTYYDTVDSPARLRTDLWYQSSSDDGVTWTAAAKVTTAPTDETTGSADSDQYGDYNCLSGHAGRFFPSWTDRRSGAREEIWTALLSFKAPAAVQGSPLTGFGIGPNLDPRVYYLDQSGHVVELEWNGRNWGFGFVGAAAPAALQGSPLAGFGIGPNLNPRVYYLDQSSHVIELEWNGSNWGFGDVT